jgi:hypothetical protein
VDEVTMQLPVIDQTGIVTVVSAGSQCLPR